MMRGKRAVLVAIATVLAMTPALTAQAATGGPGVTCTGGSSCVIELENEVSFFGNRGSGTDNPGVEIQPPPCQWVGLGDAKTGSELLINWLNQVDSIEGSLTAAEQALLTKATKLEAENPRPAGEWYYPTWTGSGTDAGFAACMAQGYVWVPAAAGGAVTPPPVPLPPKTLAQLAVAVMKLPTAGNLVTSPSHGTTYSNMPTFVRVTMRGKYETSGDMPYLMVSAALDGQGATAWAYATPLSLSSTDTDATPWSSCGYLGSAMLKDDAKKVAAIGAGGKADCGFTFHLPGTATIAAAIGWKTCWVNYAIKNYQAPPGAGDCTPVPDANLNGLQWRAGINIEEIQAGNG